MLINMRNAMLSGGWKNPYITDGLVAMWDGEWNAGPGKHDTSRNIVNLATGKAYSLDDATNSQNVTIGNNYLQVTSPCFLAIPDLAWSLDAEIPRTFEIVWTNTVQNTTTNWNRAGWVDCGFVVSMVSNVAVLCRLSRNVYRAMYSGFATTTNKIETASAVTLGVDSERRTYRNAQEISLNAHNYQSSTTQMAFVLFSFHSLAGSTSRIYTMRGYNRALTATEIAANYAIDKARFNLPDAT